MEKFVQDTSKIKVIVFDFDETFYFSSTIRAEYIDYIKRTIMALSGHTEPETQELMDNFGFTKENKNAPSFSSSTSNFDIPKSKWNEYRINNFFQFNYENAEVIDNNLLKKLAQKFKLYIVSNELEKNIRFKADKLGVDLSGFTKICAPTEDQILNENYLSKKEWYAKIAEENGLEMNNLLVIGDRKKVDIDPMLELGGQGLWITHPSEIKDFCESTFLEETLAPRAIILTVTIGAGHNQVAKNVAEQFPKDNVKIIDLFKNAPHIHNVINKYFVFMNKMPELGNLFYNISKKTDQNPFNHYIKQIEDNLIHEINDFKPDVIISSHIAGYLFVQHFGNKILKTVKNYFIVTDYDIPQNTLPTKSKNPSFVVVPNKDFVPELVKRGWNESNILPYGIPINQIYYKDLNITETAKNLGLPEKNDKTLYALVMGGGKGMGKTFSAVKTLVQNKGNFVIAVAGKNDKLKLKLDALAKTCPNLKVFGFTDQVPTLIRYADVVIGKAGGLTSTEALAYKTPIVVMGKTANPENANLEYFKKKGVALSAQTRRNLKQICVKNKISTLQPNLQNWTTLNSAQLIYKHIPTG